ncbi:MAG: putative toxin-antitoxin system toxin component, PIN family [Bdellovibrionia bacterium]
MISPRVVLDTNVLLTAGFKENSIPAEIVKMIILKEIQALNCPGIVEEYKEVFSRARFKKWKFPPPWFEIFLAQSTSLDCDPPSWPLMGPDPDDLLFLSFAHQQGAILISENMKDYPAEIRQGTIVMDPSEYRCGHSLEREGRR